MEGAGRVSFWFLAARGSQGEGRMVMQDVRFLSVVLAMGRCESDPPISKTKPKTKNREHKCAESVCVSENGGKGSQSLVQGHWMSIERMRSQRASPARDSAPTPQASASAGVRSVVARPRTPRWSTSPPGTTSRTPQRLSTTSPPHPYVSQNARTHLSCCCFFLTTTTQTRYCAKYHAHSHKLVLKITDNVTVRTSSPPFFSFFFLFSHSLTPHTLVHQIQDLLLHLPQPLRRDHARAHAQDAKHKHTRAPRSSSSFSSGTSGGERARAAGRRW